MTPIAVLLIFDMYRNNTFVVDLLLGNGIQSCTPGYVINLLGTRFTMFLQSKQALIWYCRLMFCASPDTLICSYSKGAEL